MRFILLFLILNMAVLKLHAQHCAYDQAYVIGARVFYNNINNPVENLKITLVNQWGIPVTHIAEPLLTKRKPNQSTNLDSLYCAFAPNDYIFTFYSASRATDFYYLKVEDVDGAQNFGDFGIQFFKIPPNSITGLCGYKATEANPHINYKPILIQLNGGTNHHFQTEQHNQFIFKTNYTIHRNICTATNCYGFNLSIYNTVTKAIEFDSTFIGQTPSGVLLQPFEVGDYNFDQVPDFKLLINGATYQPYFLYNPKTRHFDYHEQLSSSYSVQINHAQKSVVARSKVEQSNLPNYTHKYLEHAYWGVGFTHYTKKMYHWQTWSNNVYVELIDSVAPPSKPIKDVFMPNQIPSELKNIPTEYIDFNFDGANDLKISNPKAHYGYSIYLYNPSKNTFIFDSLLSSISIQEVNPTTKKFLGVTSKQIDELTRQVVEYTYLNGAITPTKKTVYSQPFLYSERTDAQVFEWRNNTWVATEFYRGAE